MNTFVALLALAQFTADPQCLRADAERIQRHLFDTEAALRAKTPSGLTLEQSAARARNLDHLHDYAARGVFPINDASPEPIPFFIDRYGTRCAMAALIEAEGGAAFVEHVARTRNNATVHQLTDEPALHAWLEANGMTVAEAARVQPGYTWCEPARMKAVCRAQQPWIVFRVEASDGGTAQIVVEQSHFDGGLRPGDRVQTHEDRARPLPRGKRLTAGYDLSRGDLWLRAHGEVTADGRHRSIHDQQCRDAPSVDSQTAEVLSALPMGQCQGQLTARDARWGLDVCHHISAPWDYDICLPDGGLPQGRPAPLPVHRDATGFAAGSEPVGCSSTADISLTAASALALLLLRRRTPSSR